jgi:hypothetical protein
MNVGLLLVCMSKIILMIMNAWNLSITLCIKEVFNLYRMINHCSSKLTTTNAENNIFNIYLKLYIFEKRINQFFSIVKYIYLFK